VEQISAAELFRWVLGGTQRSRLEGLPCDLPPRRLTPGLDICDTNDPAEGSDLYHRTPESETVNCLSDFLTVTFSTSE